MGLIAYAINGTPVKKPTGVSWKQVRVGDQRLDGTVMHSQYTEHTWERETFPGDDLDWKGYENAVLTSLTTISPDDADGVEVTYTDVVMGAIEEFRIDGRNFANVRVTFWVNLESAV